MLFHRDVADGAALAAVRHGADDVALPGSDGLGLAAVDRGGGRDSGGQRQNPGDPSRIPEPVRARNNT